MLREEESEYVDFAANSEAGWGRVYKYSKTPIYRAFRGKGFRPDKSMGPVNRIVK